MKDVISILKNKSELFVGNGADPKDVSAAEKKLDLLFSEEYKQYLLTFGNAAFNGIELTGITSVQRLNVESVTKKQRERISVPNDFYVIEEANIDGIVVWQDQSGAIYETYPGIEKPKQIFKSFAEYLTVC